MGEPVRTESERRIRAVVRTALSTGVWLVIAVQLLAVALVMSGIAPFGSLEAAFSQAPGLAMLLAVLILAYAYLMSGASRAFAMGTATVAVHDSLNRGREVFRAFLWLALKLLVLGLVCLYVLAIIAYIIAAAAQSKTLAQQILWSGPRIILAIAPFVFVYWLPVVFVRNDFRMAPTLRAALEIIWRRLPSSSFLAFLIFFPLLLLWLVPASAPLAVVLAVSALGQFMAWTAYVYCVESMTEGKAGTVTLH